VNLNRHEPTIDTTYFPNMPPMFIETWSSTTYASYTSRVWQVDFKDGRSDRIKKSISGYYSRAVRGGQNRLLDNLVIWAPAQAARWHIGDQKDITWETKGISGEVRISLSQQGGKEGTFEIIEDRTPNDGTYGWTVTGPESFNCMLKIEPLSQPDNDTTQGLFSVCTLKNAWISANRMGSLDKYRLILNGKATDGVFPIVTNWSSSDTSISTINNDILSAQQNSRIEVSATYMDKTYKKGLFVYTAFDKAEIESNNTKTTATSMTDGSFYRGGFYTGDVDYYKFTLPSDTYLDIGYLSHSITAEMNVEVYNSNDTLMASGISTDGRSLTHSLGLTADTYYLKVSTSGDVDQDNYYVVTYKTLGDLPPRVPVSINIGSAAQGVINHLEDAATFTFSLSAMQTIGLFFAPSGDFSKYHIEILNQGQSVVDQVNCFDHVPVKIERVFPVGDYTVQATPIEQVDAASPFTLELNQSIGQFEAEPNDTYDHATDFGAYTSITGRLSTIFDADFYTFVLETPRFLELVFTCPESDGNFYLTLYKDSPENLIDGINTLNGDDISLNMGLGIGRYYLKVASDGSTADSINYYTLTLNDSAQTNLEIESNNTLKFANAIEKGTIRKGRIYSAEDIDYYGFYLPDTALFTVSFSPETTAADYLVKLVNDNDQVIDQRSSENGAESSMEIYNLPGNYYIKVESNGDVDQYSHYEVGLTSDSTIVGLKQLVSVTVFGTQTEMAINDTQPLTATAGYSDATSEVIATPIWTSLDETVATVNEAGLVTATGEGSTSIVASYGGLTGKFDITVGAPTQVIAQHYGNLILVAGGGAEATNTLKQSTQYLSDLVYLRFRNRLFTDDDIHYFNPVSWHDIDGDGYDNNVVDDDSPTVTEFGQSVTGWAAIQSTDGPLYVYLLDHGGIDTFKIFPNEILTAAQLNGFIDTFQNATNRRVIVMIEACKSGSFTDDLVAQGDDRVIVTCTDDKNAYLQLAGRISFTQFFIDSLLTGDSIYDGWLKAKSKLSNMGLPYNLMQPQLVEGVSMASNQTMVGGDFAIASLFPTFGEQSPNEAITANTPQTLYINVVDLEGIESVWAVVLPPDYVPPTTAQDLEAPEVGLPTFDLIDTDKDGRYEEDYNNFVFNGNYRITFYARNANGNVSVSPATIVTVSGGQDVNLAGPGDVNGDGNVDLSDAILILKVLCGVDTGDDTVNVDADVNGDNKIGIEEAIHALQVVSGIKSE